MEIEAKLAELKREFYKDIDELRRKQQAFRRRVSVIANLFLPGIGFFIYGSSYLRGLIVFILFSTYNFYFFDSIVNLTDTPISVVYYTPALAIWIASTIMVAGLED